MNFIVFVLKILLVAAFAFGFYIVMTILYATVTDFKPKEKIAIDIKEGSGSIVDTTLQFYNWNIGYCGLGAESDFFYDGGSMVRPPESVVNKNREGVKKVISGWTDADFVLLQEVDIRSKRSYYRDQMELIDGVLPGHRPYLGLNYKVSYIPIPLLKPMGRVRSGVVSYSKYTPTEATRYNFPGDFSWPKSLFFLDRCFVLQRFPIGDKELVVINTHNSAYDDGSLKKQEMEYLKGVLLEEYGKGNYVIVGGDWNQCPPDYDPYTKVSREEAKYDQINIEKDYLPEGWQWAYDPSVHTNRKVSDIYRKGETFTTIIDFYLVSPNVRVNEVKGVDLDFEYSDHQPVMLRVTLVQE